MFGNGVSSEPLDANIDVGQTGDTLNSPLDIELVGVATPLNSTTVVLTSSLNPSDFGQNVTFTAAVTTGTGSLTGTVTFYDGAAILKANVALSAGAATFATAALPVGTHTITAQYNGDSTHFKSTVDAASTVNAGGEREATTTTLAAAPASPSALGASVTSHSNVFATSGGRRCAAGRNGHFQRMAARRRCATPFRPDFGPRGVVYGGRGSTTPATALAQGVNTITAAYSGDACSTIFFPVRLKNVGSGCGADLDHHADQQRQPVGFWKPSSAVHGGGINQWSRRRHRHGQLIWPAGGLSTQRLAFGHSRRYGEQPPLQPPHCP